VAHEVLTTLEVTYLFGFESLDLSFKMPLGALRMMKKKTPLIRSISMIEDVFDEKLGDKVGARGSADD
jgi:hypothetical protein